MRNYLLSEEVAFWLGITPSRLYFLISKKGFPHFRTEDSIFGFTEQKILTWLNKNPGGLTDG